jgi:sugar phosphate permease
MANPDKRNEFEQEGEEKPLTLVQEFVQFIVENKMWWLIPILLSFGLIGLLVVLSSSGAAPFIYTLF